MLRNFLPGTRNVQNIIFVCMVVLFQSSRIQLHWLLLRAAACACLGAMFQAHVQLLRCRDMDGTFGNYVEQHGELGVGGFYRCIKVSTTYIRVWTAIELLLTRNFREMGISFD